MAQVKTKGCSIVAAVNPKADEAAVAELLEKAVDLYNELRDKVAAKDIEGSKKAYYNALRKDILVKTDALYEELSATVKKAK